MRCPKCGHDTLYIAEHGITLFFWCPWCGTLVEKIVGGETVCNVPETRASPDKPA